MESVNAAGEFANTSFKLADSFAKFITWASDNPLLFRIILIVIIISIIATIFIIAYKKYGPQ